VPEKHAERPRLSIAAVDDAQQERRARNETSFRKVNEAIAAGRALADADKPVPFVCECGRVGCTEIIEVPPGGYVGVRSDPRRFLIADGHDSPEIERVVERHGTWAVVEKVGEAGEIAEEEAEEG
jgi:hypothetical protein